MFCRALIVPMLRLFFVFLLYAPTAFAADSRAESVDITIPDTAFRAFLLSHYDTDSSGSISTAEAAAVTGEMDCHSLGITSLSGFEFFYNVTSLVAYLNNIQYFPPMTSFNLHFLDLGDNALTSLPNLSSIPDLVGLYVAGNSLTALPTLPSGLQELVCSNNQLASFPNLSGLTLLDRLILNGNHFTPADCPAINQMAAAGLSSFVYDPQQNGTVLGCDQVTIPDPNLLACLLAHFDTDNDGSISFPEALAATGAPDCSGRGILSLSGIEYFLNLNRLLVGNNRIGTLPDLNSLSSLNMLDLSDNEIQQLPDLSGLQQLEYLYAGGNQLSGIPALPTGLLQLYVQVNNITSFSVADLTQLTEVRIDHNLLASFPDFSNNPDLSLIRANDNNFTAADCPAINQIVLRNLPDFVYDPQRNGSLLACDEVDIADPALLACLLANYDTNGNGQLSIVEALAATGTLNCAGRNIASLEGIQRFSNLSSLILDNNNLTGLPDLSPMQSLNMIDVGDNNLHSLPNLSSLTQLEFLYAGGNQLTSLPTLPSGLVQLFVQGNQLTSISPASLPLLTEVRIDNNQLAGFPNFTNNPLLTLLIANGNNFTRSDCPAINLVSAQNLALFEYDPQKNGTVLACDQVFIADADLLACLLENYDSNLDGQISISEAEAASGTLDCHGRSIASLAGIESFASLNRLIFYNNLLTTLPTLSSLPDLNMLDVGDNRITSLPNLSGNQNLLYLYAGGNQLTSLPSLPPGLIELAVNGNQLTAFATAALLPQLADLNLQDNFLTSFPDFSGNPALVKLQIDGNQFRASDCPVILSLAARNLQLFQYDPQRDGSLLACDRTVIPDAAFEACLIAHFDTNRDGYVSLREAGQAVGPLDCSVAGINSLDGIHQFPGINELFISDNNLTSLPSLAALTGLRDLRAARNRLTSLPVLSAQPGLLILDLETNQIASLPVLSANTNLFFINLNHNRLQSLPNLAALSRLTDLHLRDNQLTQVPGLSSLVALMDFDISQNRFTTLPDISGLDQLEYVDASENQISQVPVLHGLAALMRLNLADNLLTSIDPFVNLDLNWLRLSRNRITQVPDMNAMSGLEELYLDQNDLGSASNLFLRLPAGLKLLGLNQANLRSAQPLSRFSLLQELRLAGNLLAELPPLTGLNALELLYLNDNDFVTPPEFPSLPALRHLGFSGNQLTQLPDLSHLPTLTSVNFAYNFLWALDALPLPGDLEVLRLAGNGIEQDPGFHLFPSLRILDLGINQLESLDSISALTHLEELYLNSNNLSLLAPNVPASPGLRSFHVEDNLLTEGECALIGQLLSSIPDFIFNPQREGLLLACNNITSLPEGYSVWMAGPQNFFCGQGNPDIRAFLTYIGNGNQCRP